MDYEKRVDFRAFDVLADAIEHATPDELANAINSCSEVAASATYKATTRLLFRCFTNMLRLYQRKFNRDANRLGFPRKSALKIARGL